MMGLHQLQQDLQAYLMGYDSSITTKVITTSKVDVTKRLLIYANAYRLRLQECLQDDFPTLHVLLGDEQFSELAYDYIRSYPSQYRSIRWFGEKLSLMLRQQQPYANYPYLAEVADFEWAIGETFDAENAAVVEIEQMAQIPPDAWAKMRIQFHPSMRRLNLSWNAMELRKQAQQEQELLPQLHEHPVAWLIWRQQLTTHFISMPADVAWAVDAISQGATFAEVCSGLCEWIDEAEAGMHAATLLKSWLINGLICKISII